VNTAQIVQVIGALPILAAFVAAQLGRLDTRSKLYLGLNVLGSAVLGVIAFVEAQWGFLLIECVWGLVSLWTLIKGSTPLGSATS
jgi:hypothetical protein